MTKFKPLLPLVTLAAAIGLGSQQAQAYQFNPTIGVDGAFAFFNYDENYGDPIYKENDGMVNPYVGVNLFENFGLELGFQWLPQRNNSVRLGPGELPVSGGPVAIGANQFADIESEWEMVAPYLGLTFNLPLTNCKRVSLFGMLGGAYAHIKADENIVGTQAGVVAPAFNTHFSDGKLVFTAKAGVSWMMTDYVGLRAFGSYMNTSSLEINADNGAVGLLRPKDTFLVGAGIFVTNFM